MLYMFRVLGTVVIGEEEKQNKLAGRQENVILFLL